MNALIRKTALLGTDKAPLPSVIPLPTPLRHLYQQIPPQNQELTFLTIVSTHSLYTHLGWLPPKHPPPTPCTTEEKRSLCTQEAEADLQQLLTTHFRPLLAEWLLNLNRQQLRLPPIYIPQLLNLGINWENLRPLILSVLGENGRWLAAQNEKWVYATLPTTANVQQHVEENWLKADFTARRTLLHQQRAQDPALGIQLLQLDWHTTPSHQNAQLLALLRPHLSTTDEPFLEQLLDDSSQQIRRLTIQLLSELSGSRLTRRMGKEITKLISWDKEKNEWQIILPEQHTPQMARDGVLKQAAPKQWGEKGWWLLQMIESSPLSSFTTDLSELTDQLVAMQKESLAPLIIQGWCVACLRQKNQLWAKGLLKQYLFHSQSLTHVDPYHIRLLSILPIAEREEIGQQLLTNTEQHSLWQEKQPLLLLLEQFNYPWHEQFAQTILQTISNHIIQEDDTHVRLMFRHKFQDLAQFFPVSLYNEIEDQLNHLTQQNEWLAWKKPVASFLERLSFRKTMLAHLKEESS